MTYEMYRYVFLGGAAACAILLVVSAVLFFVLRIPKVISDLTGRTARKAIENIRIQNERSGDKTYQSSAVNLQRGKLTDKISKSGRLVPREESPFGTGVITEKISTQQLCEEPADETTVLREAEQTTVLSPAGNETTVLELQPEQTFVVEYDVTFVFTNEVIV